MGVASPKTQKTKKDQIYIPIYIHDNCNVYKIKTMSYLACFHNFIYKSMFKEVKYKLFYL